MLSEDEMHNTLGTAADFIQHVLFCILFALFAC